TTSSAASATKKRDGSCSSSDVSTAGGWWCGGRWWWSGEDPSGHVGRPAKHERIQGHYGIGKSHDRRSLQGSARASSPRELSPASDSPPVARQHLREEQAFSVNESSPTSERPRARS